MILFPASFQTRQAISSKAIGVPPLQGAKTALAHPATTDTKAPGKAEETQ